MSVPPPGGWQDPGVPPIGGQPYGQQFNPSRYGAQQPPPPGWQQGAWPQQPSPPPNKGNSLKWLLIAVAVLLVVGISVGATLIFTRGDGGGGSTPSSGAASKFASAGDTGPVAVITDEPTCKQFLDLNDSLSDVQGNGWGDQRATLGPISEWTANQRTQAQAVGSALRKAADQAEPLARQTPHRLVRELYEQFIAYGRAYAESIPTYAPPDNGLASANVNTSAALFGICQSIEYGSASRSIGVPAAASPSTAGSIIDPKNSSIFLDKQDASCDSWARISEIFTDRTSDWQKRDTSVPASQWSTAQRVDEEAARPLLIAFATDMEGLGRKSGNPVFEDFAVAAALYIHAAVSAEDDYIAADSYLSYVAFRFSLVVSGACRAAGR